MIRAVVIAALLATPVQADTAAAVNLFAQACVEDEGQSLPRRYKSLGFRSAQPSLGFAAFYHERMNILAEIGKQSGARYCGFTLDAREYPPDALAGAVSSFVTSVFGSNAANAERSSVSWNWSIGGPRITLNAKPRDRWITLVYGAGGG